MRPRLLSDDVLLDAALTAFGELGYEGASIRALCRRLDISHNTLNQRFGSKETLWYATADHAFRNLIGVLLEAATSTNGDPFDQLRASALSFLEHCRETPGLIQVINQESALPGPRYNYIFTRYIAPINEVSMRHIRQLQQDGVVRPGPVTTIFYHLTTIGLGLMSSHPESFPLFGDHDVDVVEAAELAVDLVLDGLRPRA